MEYLISDEKIAKMRNYRSQRVLDYIKDNGFRLFVCVGLWQHPLRL